MLYAVVLLVHSWLRWVVLALGAYVLAERFHAWRSGGDVAVSPVHTAFIHAIDLQVVLGLTLYVVLSPLTRLAFGDLSATMGNPVLRFYSIEHVFGMLVSVAAAHIGFDRLRRSRPLIAAPSPGPGETPAPAATLRFALAAQTVWLLAILASVPWPVLPYGRPLFRTFL